MSILIRGIEMPKDGDTVVLVISNENGKLLAEVDEYCGAVYEAIPVPPHGDLIDRDALFDKIPPGDLEHDKLISRSGAIADVCTWVLSAPTIIPTDQAEEDE